MRHTAVAMCLAALLALACGPAFALLVDLTTPLSSGWWSDGVYFESMAGQPAGTGVFEPFLRLQHKGTEAGYNTNGITEFDTKTGIWTHAIVVSDIPLALIGGTLYRQFALDINETSASPLLSLDVVELYTSNVADLTNYAGWPAPIYANTGDSGNDWVKLNYLNPGSGVSDMVMYIPNSVFSSSNDNDYLYLYTEFGQRYEADEVSSDAGFEEWAVIDSLHPVPEPASCALLALAIGGIGVGLKKRRK